MGILDGMMSGVAGAASGVAGASKDIYDHQQAQQHDIDMQNLAEQKAKNLAQWNVEMANQQRAARVERIQDAEKSIIAPQMANQYNSSDSAVSDLANSGNPVSQDVLDTIQQAKDNTQKSLMSNPDNIVAGAAASGDIDPDKLMQTNSKQEIAQMNNQMKEAMNNNKYDTLFEIAKMKGDFGMQLHAMKEAKDGTDSVMAHAVFNSAEQAIRDNNTTIGQLNGELNNVRQGTPEYTDRHNTINQLRTQNQQYRQQQVDMAKSFGFKMPDLRPVDNSTVKPPQPVKVWDPKSGTFK